MLYDVEAQRGWLVDVASALLHLVRTQVVQEPYGGAGSLFNNPSFNYSTFNHPGIDGGPNAAAEILKDVRNMAHIILKEFSSYADETIAMYQPETLPTVSEGFGNKANDSGKERTIIYKTTCFRDLVTQAWSTLEQIYDRQIEIATTHTTKEFQIPFQKRLEGYEFMDIVSAEHTLTRRFIKLQSNGAVWIDLTRQICAITLFGQYFGEIYKPTDDTGIWICKNWNTVPRGHQYLVVPIFLLKEIKKRSWKKGEIDEDSPEIAEGIVCSPLEHAFKTCERSCKHIIYRVQQFRSSRLGELLDKADWSKKGLKEADIFAKINGALLFGENSDLDVKRLECSSPPLMPQVNDFHDSGIGSSLQAPSQANSATASSCSESPDSNPALPSAHSLGALPSLLNQSSAESISRSRTEVIDTICLAGNRSSINHASTEAGPTWVQQSHGGIMARGNSTSQKVMSPGPVVTNLSTDVPAMDQAQRRRGNFMAGLRMGVAKVMPSRWKRGEQT